MYEAVVEFAYALAENARIFTLEQVAKHPLLAWRTQPIKRASEALRTVADDFEKIPGPFGEPFRLRLSKKAQKRRGIEFRNIPAHSQKVNHWLALGDVYIVLRLHGGVKAWEIEPKKSANFDIFCVYGQRAFLMEVQRYPINSKIWADKWKSRIEFLSSQTKLKAAPWQPINRIVRPQPVLVDLTNQERETVGMPEHVLLCRKVEELPHVLNRYIMKTQEIVKPPQS